MGKAEEPVKENYEKLVARLLEMSALTLTSVVDCSSQISDSHLKLLRGSQRNLLAARPKLAVIKGKAETGKSAALEFGLAFVKTTVKSYSRFLVSLAEYGSAQNGA